jgi:hypothetical protein
LQPLSKDILMICPPQVQDGPSAVGPFGPYA